MIVLLSTQNTEIKKQISKLDFPDFNVVNVGNADYLKHYIEEYIPEYVIVSNTIKNIEKITEFIMNRTSSKLIIAEDKIEKSAKKNPGCIYVDSLKTSEDLKKIFDVIATLGKDKKKQSITKNKYVKQELISFYSAQGGCGKTTIAFNFAWSLRKMKSLKVLFIDLNFHEGPTDLVVNLNVNNFPNIFNFIEKSAYGGSLKESVINLKNTNIDMLFPPVSIKQSDNLSIEVLNELIYEARNNYNFIVTDMPFCYSNINLEMLSLSTMAVSINAPEISSSLRLKNMAKYLNHDMQKIHILNNLRNTDLRIIPQIETILEEKVFYVIPFIAKADRNFIKGMHTTYSVLDMQRYLNNMMDIFA
jgi:MinD-like ATPase involved in chromosome partitioning or flagellar assembly